MATSGDTTFGLTLAEINRGAALKLGVIAHHETMNAAMSQDFTRALNAMVKRWAATDIRVWAVREAVLFPAVEQTRYQLGNSSSDHATESYVATTLSADEASGQTALSVTSDDGISDNDYLGVVLDDGTLFWTTVNGTPAGDVVTVDNALTSAASSGNAVFAYTTKMIRPLRIPNHEGAVRRHNIESGTDTPIGPPMARLDYHALPRKTENGLINQVFYDPQRAAGYLHIWQPQANITDLVKFTWHKTLEDFDDAANDPDFPQEWIDTLIFNLAVVMAPEFDVPTDKLATIAALAATFLDDLSGYGRETESVFFGPDYSR